MQICRSQNSFHNSPARKSSVAFKGGYYSTSDDIKIRKEVVNSPVSTISGDVKVKDSKLNSYIESKSGDIKVNGSTVQGFISTKSGNIDIQGSSTVNGPISTMSGNVDISESTIHSPVSVVSGDISVDTSKVVGDLATEVGKISIENSEVDGVIKTAPDKLELNGKNTLKDIILRESKSQGGNSINIYNGSIVTGANFNGATFSFNTFNNGFIHIDGAPNTLIINGQKVDLSKTASEAGKAVEAKVHEFRLPSGNEVTGMFKFETAKPGVLLLEDGAKFTGRLINGVLKHIMK